jgi:hypothetical protein
MRGKHLNKLMLVCGSLLALAASGCGQTGDSLDTQAGASDLRGADRVGAARGDGGVRDRDKDVDETADEAAQGAAGGRADRGGKGRVDDDADGGVDEDCFGGFRRKRVGFGGRRGDGDKDGPGRGEAGSMSGGSQGPGSGEAGHAGGRPGRGRGGAGSAGGP